MRACYTARMYETETDVSRRLLALAAAAAERAPNVPAILEEIQRRRASYTPKSSAGP